MDKYPTVSHMTLRQQYAMNAPPVPDWFEPGPREKSVRFFNWRWHYADMMLQEPEQASAAADELIKTLRDVMHKTKEFVHPVAIDPEPYEKLFKLIERTERVCQFYFANK